MDLYQMVLDIVPDNLIMPFSQGNTLQIMFIGIVAGVMMLTISKDTQVVAKLTQQLGYIIDGMMGAISKLIPFFVFGNLFVIIASSEAGFLAAGGKFVVATLAGCILLMLFHTAVACGSMRITPLDLWRRTLSTFFIAITTSSSSAAFADNKKRALKSWASASSWRTSAFPSDRYCIARPAPRCSGLPRSAWPKTAA